MEIIIKGNTWSNSCRACLTTKESFSYFLFKDVSPETYLFCTSIQVKEDESLPKALCEVCYELLNNYSKFKRTCIESQNALLRTTKIKMEAMVIIQEYNESMELNYESQNETANTERKYDYNGQESQKEILDTAARCEETDVKQEALSDQESLNAEYAEPPLETEDPIRIEKSDWEYNVDSENLEKNKRETKDDKFPSDQSNDSCSDDDPEYEPPNKKSFSQTQKSGNEEQYSNKSEGKKQKRGAQKKLSNCGIPEPAKSEIDKLFALRMKPMSIINALQEMEGIELPKIAQIRKYICDLRNAKNENHQINMGELQQWLQENSALPENPHETFVIARNNSKKDATSKFVLSTKYLLELACDANLLHVDTTHKLTWQECSVLVIGTTDKQQKFHPLCLAVSPTEEKDDFQLIFEGMKNKILSLLSKPFKPAIFITDGTKNIHDAAIDVFEDISIKVCWAHIKKQIKSRVLRDVEKSVQKQMLQDVENLHLITNRDDFNKACDLFVQKYDSQTNVISYFKEYWQHQNWHLGATPKSPSTNIALEGFIKLIKDSYILRERFPVSQFLTVVKKMVNKWSAKYIENPRENSIAKSPVISLKDWTNAYNWANLPNKIEVKPSDDNKFTYYQILGAENKQHNFDTHPENFDEFMEHLFSKWEVAFPVNIQEWMQGKCTCPTYFNTYICEHIIGLSIRLGRTAPPTEAKIMAQVNQKRKRGRTTKRQKALIVP